jgi:hypothetical protein
MDSPGDYSFGGDLWNCPNPQRLAVLYGTAMGWTDVVPQSHLTSGTGITVAYTDSEGEHRTFSVGASFLQDFAANRPGFRVPVWSWPGKTR